MQTLKIHNGVMAIGYNGRPETVDGMFKTKQDLAEVQLNEYDPRQDWGSDIRLTRLIGTLPNLHVVLYDFVRMAVNRLMRHQEADLDRITESERITKIIDIFVQRTQTNTLRYLVIVQVASGDPVAQAIEVGLEQQTALQRLFSVQV